MKRLIGLLIVVSLIAVAGTAFAAELNIGSRFYTKFLSRNSYDPARYVTTGNGVGIRSELEITLDGRVSDRAEMGGRILSVWDAYSFISPAYSDWWGWYDDRASLWQVRGMWLKFRPATIPTVKSVLIGSTDRGMFNEWTIGKSRWIDRDNARIIYAEGEIGRIMYGIGMTPMSQTWLGPDWNTGTSPRSVWATGGTLAFSPTQTLNLKMAASHILAPQMDTTPPVDETKAVTRYHNAVETLEIGFQPNPVLNINGLVALSNIYFDPTIVTVFWPIPNESVSGNAYKLTAIASDPFGIGLTLKGEAFDVKPDFVSILAPRVEGKVLLSEGHVRYSANQTGSTWKGSVGYTPSPVPTDEFTDWNEQHNVSIHGWNGLTFIPEYRAGALGIKGEVSMMSNDLNSQNVDTTKYWYSASQVDESTNLAAIRIDYLLPIGSGLGVFAKYKMVNWKDGVDTSIVTDDFAMDDTETYAGASYQLTDELGLIGGYKSLNYVDKGDGIDQNLKTYELQAGMVFAEVKYNVGGVDIGLAYEKVDGEDKVTAGKVNDMRLKATAEVKI